MSLPTPYFQDDSVTIYHADCRDILPLLSSVTTVVTDPPYELGFMGKDWDKQGVSFDSRTWELVLNACLPGAPLLAFGGTRTHHRIWCAIEDAGWEIRDTLMWLYGCLSEDTEVLTKQGWERYHIARTKEILVYDIEADIYQWESPERWSAYSVQSDTAFRIVSDSTDQLVSRNHRCLVEQEGRLVFVAAEMLASVERVPFLPRDLSQLPQLQAPLLLKTMQRASKGSRVEGAWSQGPCCLDRQEQGVLPREDVRRTEPRMERRCDLLQDPRQLQGSEVCALPSRLRFDGSGRRLCYGASLVGRTEDRQTTPKNRGGSSLKPRSGRQQPEGVALCQQPRPQAIRGGTSYQTTLARVSKERYSGIFFCPTVSTGAFVARRNGHVFITGNSGFPKSLDISKAIDKAAGAEREVIGRRPDWVVSDKWRETEGRADRPESILDITAPATDSAKEWQGYGTALKPAFEPICLAMKPLDGTFAHNALTHGVAGLNIDGARIPTTDKLQTLEGSFSFSGSGGANETGKKIAFRDAGQGRWPANLLLSHTPECKCVGTKKVKGDGHFPKSRYKETDIFGGGKGLPINTGHEEVQMGEEEVESWECTPDCPVRMLDEQSGERPSNGIYRKQGVSETSGGFIRTWDRTYEQRNQYAGDIGGASRFFYTAKASRSERDPMCEELLRNDHATVKPLDLMIYLVKLVMPPKNGVVLDPFMGSGTTGLACQKLGVRFMGIDNKERNCEIAARRMSQSVMQL